MSVTMAMVTRVALVAAVTMSAAMTRAAVPASAIEAQAGPAAVSDPQVKDDLFAGTEKFARGATDATDVDLGPNLLGLVSGNSPAAELAHKLNFVLVRTYTYPNPGMYKLADVEVYRQKLRSGGWTCVIHTYDAKGGDSTDVCIRELADHEGNEMALLTVDPKDLTFIHISGNVSLADLGKLGSLGSLGAPALHTRPSPPK